MMAAVVPAKSCGSRSPKIVGETAVQYRRSGTILVWYYINTCTIQTLSTIVCLLFVICFVFGAFILNLHFLLQNVQCRLYECI